MRLLRPYLGPIEALRDLSPADLERHRRALPELVYRRCRHIVTENTRVLEAERALKAGDFVACGKAMNASHASMRDDFEITCPEIDLLVGLAQGQPGVYGSRMTGGGFGGCTVSLIEASAVERVSMLIAEGYPAGAGREAEVFVCSPSNGAGLVPPGRSLGALAKLDLGEASHRRLNPLTGEWTLVSPHRMKRPWQGKREALAAEPSLAHDPNCYLCPGNLRANGARNPPYTHTFVFDNDFAALHSDAPPERVEDGLLVAEGESGLCRVLCFSPRHDLTLAQMDVVDVERVVDAWVEETISLGLAPGRGFRARSSRTVARLWAARTRTRTGRFGRRAICRTSSRRRRIARPPTFCNSSGRFSSTISAQELALEKRIVFANDDFCALVPFWAVWPFETMILPRRPIHGFDLLSAGEKASLAAALSELTRRYDRLFDVSFPYSMGFHQRPTDGAVHPEWQMHAHFYPPLLRSAAVKKFMVGFEMLGSPQRDLTPEAAAARLREAAA